MQKWEYIIIQANLYLDINFDKTVEEINNLGEEGWELVATVPDEGGDYPRLIFKRSKS